RRPAIRIFSISSGVLMVTVIGNSRGAERERRYVSSLKQGGAGGAKERRSMPDISSALAAYGVQLCLCAIKRAALRGPPFCLNSTHVATPYPVRSKELDIGARGGLTRLI